MEKENNIYYKNNQSFFEELFLLISQFPRSYHLFLKHSKKYLLEWIEEQLNKKLIGANYKISTKVYWIINGIQEFPKCKKCKSSKKYIGKNVKLGNGYHEYCCKECFNTSDEFLKKQKESFQKKTKEEWLEIQKKRNNTNLLKYGDQNFNNRIKAKLTCLNKYGVENQNQLQDIKDKIKHSKKIHHGNENFNNREKAKQTCLEKYNVENISQLQDVKDKKCNSSLQHFGFKNQNQSQKIKDKIKNTCLERYGVDNYSKLESRRKLLSINRIFNSYKLMCQSQYDVPVFTLKEYEARQSDEELLKFKCRKCGRYFESKHQDGQHKHCIQCFPLKYEVRVSLQEHEIQNFLKSLNNNIICNDRQIIQPYELDIFVNDKRIAIEYDGLYWHSEQSGKSKSYHLNKTLLCQQKNIQLIHIFENEWIYKNEIVKSKLKNLLGIYDKTIFARKCQIKEISNKDSRDFQEVNHLQGAVNSKVNIGLFYDDQLVSLMTFDKCRFDKKHEWEMLRFCNKLGYHIPGGASKLLSYFEKNYKPKSLVSYADRRWSQGKLYEKLGFKLDHISAPNYWYIFGDTILSRIKFQKHKLKNILKDFDENKTEVQNMKDNGYNRIFDCGNYVFIKKVNKSI